MLNSRPPKLGMYDHQFRNKFLPAHVARVADLTFDAVMNNNGQDFAAASEAPADYYYRKARDIANKLNISLSVQELSNAGLEARRQYRIHCDSH